MCATCMLCTMFIYSVVSVVGDKASCVIFIFLHTLVFYYFPELCVCVREHSLANTMDHPTAACRCVPPGLLWEAVMADEPVGCVMTSFLLNWR